MSGPRLFPSEGKTSFGEWIKAGALKQGDRVSTAKSIAAKSATPDGAASEAANDNRIDDPQTPPPVANDNAPLVVSNILLNDHLARVYNFEVESRQGEITHNYLVGNEQAWVHNARIRGPKRLAQYLKDPFCMYCGKETKFSGPQGGPRTDRFSCEHIVAQANGGGDGSENIGTACVPCNARRINMR